MKYLIYFLYRADGKVDSYVPHFLSHVRDYFDVIHLVSNGEILPEGKALLTMADKVQERPNVEFDVGAYKDALFSNPDDFYQGVDELTLANFTFFAPIGSFAPMFDWAGRQKVDFWGISAHKSMTPNPLTGSGVMPYHIQSHWISVRRPMLQRPEFLAYWRELPTITSYTDSVLYHESQFTRHFAELGHSYALYFDDAPFDSAYPAFNRIDKALEAGLPILKRRLFYHMPTLYYDNHDVNLGRALEHVESKGLFPADLIWESAVGTDPGVLYQNADLLRILPTSDQGAAPAETFDALVLVTGPLDAAARTALARHLALPARVTLLVPSEAETQGLADLLGDGAKVEPYDDLETAFARVEALAEAGGERPMLFAALDGARLGSFEYGMRHLAGDAGVAGGAVGALEVSRFFGLGLPVIRPYGAPAETDLLTAESRAEIVEDLADASFPVKTGMPFLFSQSGVFWLRPALLAAAAREIRTRLVEPMPQFADLAPGPSVAPRIDPKKVETFLSVGLPLLAARLGLVTLVLSNTRELPRAFVKAEARLRTLSEPIGARSPFVLNSKAEFLSQFLVDEDREAFFGEVQSVAFHSGWEAGQEAQAKEREKVYNLASKTGWDHGYAAARKDMQTYVQQASEATWKAAYEAAMKELQENMRQAHAAGWNAASEAARAETDKVFNAAYSEGWEAAKKHVGGGDKAAFDAAYNKGWEDAVEKLKPADGATSAAAEAGPPEDKS